MHTVAIAGTWSKDYRLLALQHFDSFEIVERVFMAAATAPFSRRA